MNRREVEDLAISFLVLLLLFSDFNPRMMLPAAIAILTAFVFHELAHRWVARRFGYYAVYRRWDTGIVLALLLGVATKALTGSTWIFAAVGAVQIYSLYGIIDRRAMGITALAGPATNILIAVIFLALHLAGRPFSGGIVGLTVGVTAMVNAWLAFFNLWPIPPLDGWKVLRWNAGYWAVAIGIAYALNTIV
ncbi:site-2 protease family protein [Thermococcus sp. Bubb.Bath]|uniref:site-2 protease family protein n=1 Tax=Thermococcus sp. Bubb.Bath TaxID=1638242 RepID=UPI0014393B18|nr:site-2 protease family protein [Thermococcus sp. Bubb.Bath]NJF24384.1 site-2 protease family protein [Thermococcus sp. Bubb.Bath]